MRNVKQQIALLLVIIMIFSSISVLAEGDDNKSKERVTGISGVKEISEGATKIYLDGRTGDDNNSGKTTDAGVKTFAKASEIVDGLNGDAIISITSPVLVDNEEWNVGGETKYLQVDETFGTTTMTIKNKITGDNIPDANTIFKYKVLKEVDGSYIPLVGEYTVDGKNSELNDLKKLENGIFEMKRDSIVKLINLEMGNYKFILLNENNVYNNHMYSFFFREDRPNPEKVEKDVDSSEVIFSTDLGIGHYDQKILFAHNYDYETSNDSGTIVVNMFEIGYKLFDDEEVGIKLSKYGGGLGAVSYRINDGPIQSGIPQNGILEVKIKNRDVLRFIDLEEAEYSIEEVVEAYRDYAYYVTFSDPTNYIKSKNIRIDLKSGSDNYFGATFVNHYNGGGTSYTTFDEVIKVDNSLTIDNIVFDGKSLDKNPNYLGLDNIILAEKEIIFNNSAIQRFNRNIQSAVVQLKNGSLVLDNTTVTDNYTNTKGVIYIDNEEIEESLISNITNSTFTNNTNLTNDINSEIGNVIHLLSASINISESNFENNQTNKKAVIFIESGYYNDIRKESTINETSISNNNGTGLEVHKHNDVILKDSNIYGNIRAQGSENAVNAAGLIVADSAKVTMNGGSISKNKNIPMEGEKYYSKLAGGVGIAGASYGYEPATFIMNSGSISKNIGSHGGGVSIAGDVLLPSRRIGLFYGEQSLTNGIFTMNSGEVSGNKAIGLPYAISSGYPPLDESVGLPGEGGGIYFGDGMVKISGDSNIKDNTAIWQFKDENFAKTLPVSMSFPRGNGIFVKNMSSVLNGNGLYLSGSPKINSNNDVFLNGDLRDNGVVQSFIQADDTFIGEGEGGENQIQITTPINYIKDYSNENKYILSTRPNVEPAEKADVKVMGTPLVYYSTQELAKAAEDAKFFKASSYMSKENGYDEEKYPEYKDGFNINQSKFENAESYLTFGGSSVKPISSLEISKTLAGDKQPDPDSIFEFDIVIVDPENWDSTPLEGEYKVGEDIRQIEEGKISIKAGETAIIENLSSSEKFIITEIYYPEDNHGGTTIKVDDDIDHTIGQDIGVETVAGKATKLEFFNYYYDSSQELHSLKLQKTVEGNKELEDEKFEFTLKYKYPYEDEYLLVNGFYKLEGNDKEFEIKDGKISLSHNDGLATLKLVDEYGYRLYVYKLLITETKPTQEGYRNTDISVKNTDKELNDSLEVEVDVVEHGDPTFILPEVTFKNNYGEEVTEYKVKYDGNGNTSGVAPTDVNRYFKDDKVVVKDEGNLEKLNQEFIGWNTKADGSGTSYDAADVFEIQDNVTLYAQWKLDAPEPENSSIVLTKKVTGNLSPRDEVYKFTITDEKGIETVLDLKANETEILDKLADGKYTITEERPSSEYYLGTDITKGGVTERDILTIDIEILNGSSSTVIFTNNYDNRDVPVDPPIEPPVYPEPEPELPSEPVEPDPVPEQPKPELNKEDHFAYMIGYSDGNFMPNANITRAEALTIFFRMLTEDSRNLFWSSTNDFNDVNESAWYNNAVSTMLNAKVIESDVNGNYRPNEAITRAEFAVLLTKFFEETNTATHNFIDISGHWAESEIARVAEKGWITGYQDKTFRPDEPISRAETVKLVNAILERTPDINKLLPNMIEFHDNLDRKKWYYVLVQEATNSHEYEREDVKSTETWTKLLPVRDWAALEKEWSKANSSTNPGEVK